MPDAIALTWRQYRLERRLFWRNPSAAFFNFLLPLIFLGFFGAILHGNQKSLNVIVPGIAGMSVLSTTFSALAFNLTFLREQGVLKRMRGTPLPPGSYLGGVAANAVTNTFLQILIVVVAGKALFGVDGLRNVPELGVFVLVGVI
ncbi:MAG TPA: ABC transporter permease, partial [Solirubrobacteraceae bacterium]